MKKIIIACLTVGILNLMGCSDGEQEPVSKAEVKKPVEVKMTRALSVSDYDYTLAGKPAVLLSFGDDVENFVSITMLRSNVVGGYSVHSKNRAYGNEVTAELTWKSTYYVQSSKHNTEFSFSIISIDEELKTVTVEFSGVFVDPSTDRYLTIGNRSVMFSGVHYSNLISL